MKLEEALRQSQSNTAQSVQGDGRTITVQSGVLLHRSTVHSWAMGAGVSLDELGYGVMVAEKGEVRPFHSKNVEELWEVEKSLRVNFGYAEFDWQPHEIEEAQ
jgi:hypothetical protein